MRAGMTSTHDGKVGRNDPCPCGSGRKYKKCCLESEIIIPVNAPGKRFRMSAAEIKKSSARLLEKAQENFGHKATIITLPQVKMSEIILHLAEDMLRASVTDDQEHKAIGTACIAWNIAVAAKSNEDLKTMINDACIKVFKSAPEAHELLTHLIDKKKQHYPDLDRIIMGYDLVQQASGGLYLNIASTPSSKESEYLSKELAQKSSVT